MVRVVVAPVGDVDQRWFRVEVEGPEYRFDEQLDGWPAGDGFEIFLLEESPIPVDVVRPVELGEVEVVLRGGLLNDEDVCIGIEESGVVELGARLRAPIARADPPLRVLPDGLADVVHRPPFDGRAKL